MPKKQIKIITLLLLCISLGSQVAKAMETNSEESKSSIKRLPVELLEMISRDIIRVSTNFNQAIKNFKSFAIVLRLQKPPINLLDEEYKKKDIIDIFSETFRVPPFIVAKRLSVKLTDESQKELKEKAICRILERHNITTAELKAWLEVNIDRADTVFKEFTKIFSYSPMFSNMLFFRNSGSFMDGMSKRELLIAVATALIYTNADPNFKYESRRTALLDAVEFRNDKDIVELLLNANADTNFQDKLGQTALMSAVRQENKEIIELLVNANADPNIRDKDGETALLLAAWHGEKDIVELLVNANADPNIQNAYSGTTALMWAAFAGNEKIVELLLNSGAHPNIQNKKGETALMLATKQGHKDKVEILLKSLR